MKLIRFEFNGDIEFPRIIKKEFVVEKETAKGYFIRPDCYSNKLRFIRKEGKKKFAYESEEKAMINYLTRTEWRLSHLEYYIKQCNLGLGLIKKMIEEKENEN